MDSWGWGLLGWASSPTVQCAEAPLHGCRRRRNPLICVSLGNVGSEFVHDMGLDDFNPVKISTGFNRMYSS
jgi:hypothetical protein